MNTEASEDEVPALPAPLLRLCMNIHLTSLHSLYYAVMSLWIRILKQYFVLFGEVAYLTYFPCAGESVLTCVGPYEMFFIFPNSVLCFFPNSVFSVLIFLDSFLMIK